MKKLTTIITLLGTLWAMVGCLPDEPTTPIPNEESPAFEITIDRLTKTSVGFSIEPLDKTMSYLVMVIDKVTFDSFESEDAYLDDDMEYLRQNAESNNMTLKELLEQVLEVGDMQATVESLSPNTAYYIYAYHLTVNGEIVSDLTKKEFTTQDYTLNEDTYTVSVSDVGYNSAVVSVIPSNTSATYFMNIMDEEEYNSYGGNEEAYMRHLEALRNYYLNFGKSPEEMIANLCFVGEASLEFDELYAGVNYYAYAMSVDEEFMVCSEVEVVEFTTPKPAASANSWTVEIDGIYYNHIEGRVVPSNNDPYICSIQHAKSLEWFDNDKDIYMSYLSSEFNKLQGGIEAALRSGTTDLSELNNLSPNTEYMIVCFGWDGAPTTELFTYNFTTEEANDNADNLVVDFEITHLGYGDMRVECTPSLGAWYFCSVATKAQVDEYIEKEGGVKAAFARLADEEIDYGASYFYCSRIEYIMDMSGSVGFDKIYFPNLEPNTDYYVYAVAVDIESGEVVSEGCSYEEFTTLEQITSEATVQFKFGDYYDGSELAEIDAAKFNSCKGQVVVPYDVVTTSAHTWYSMYNLGDYTEWGCDDKDIIAQLVTYGANMGVEEVSVNRTSGVAVLRYDEIYTFMGIAEDADGNFGKGTLQVVSFGKEGVSPAEEFIASLATSASFSNGITTNSEQSKNPILREIETPSVMMSKPTNAVDDKPKQKGTKSTTLSSGVRFLPTR